MDRIAAMLPAPEGEAVLGLWLELEAGETPEARFVRALDHPEVRAQHNLEPVGHEPVYTKMDARCAHDAVLRRLGRPEPGA
jgi:putative hydrolase of HD superfamily